ncbi:MAG TPA: UbiA family prenyltransferase, partial [Syntrophales bacterium]|nr:UbiA family prenyltransferase [Syntrophales bacterium]
LQEESMDQMAISHPLVVDLDGTLVKTDLLVESFFALIKRNPLYVLAIPIWLLKGKAFLKQQVHQRIGLDVGTLPYHEPFLDYLKDQRCRGRRLVLATGSDQRIALQIAGHLQLFDSVLASDGSVNLTRRAKQKRLVAEFGEKGFDYAGNGRDDLDAWSSARRAILVNAAGGVSRRAARITEIEKVFSRPEERLKPFLKALRLHHWLKNVLVFVPLALAYRYGEPGLPGKAFLAFLSFGLSASCVYLVNDLVDLPADRRHPRKRLRPFASGQLSLLSGLVMAPLLLAASIVLACFLPLPFLAMLLLYFFLNLGYSFTMKQIVILDVIILAGLYTMRILAGSAAVSIWPSAWLAAFSMFIFFSLALVKRYAELVLMKKAHGEDVQVRGYLGIDRELLAAMGAGSGYLAVLVLAMYISSGTAEILYKREAFIWLLCPLALYWISYVWLIAHRGRMDDDPLVFATKNPVSQIVAVLAVVIILLAR